MKKREGESWMPADEYGRTLKSGIGVNLLVRDVAAAIEFQTKVLLAETVYGDPDFAVMRSGGTEWMLHADHTYRDHELAGIIADVEARGAGIELRVYGRDPDAATKAARDGDWTVLSDAIDKVHGQREAHIIDDDGYVWVPGISI
jgi:catechol 2,3-dioxygenase-like lactoylglutathione lyase family enzyme